MNKKLLLITLFSLTVAIVTGQNLERQKNADDKYGFVDKNGREVIPCKYEYAGNFFDDLAVVKHNDKYGFIDKTGYEVIQPKYEMAYSFSQGRAEVKLNGKWGMIDKKGNILIPIQYSENEIEAKFKEFLSTSFNYFAKRYVEEKVNEWQKKGRYETTSDWQLRVTPTARKEKIDEFRKDAHNEFIELNSKKIQLSFIFNPNNYDADRGVFLIKSHQFGDLLVHVPNTEAPEFEASWNKIIKTPKYFVENDHIALAEVSFMLPDSVKTYTYSNKASLEWFETKVDYNFDPIDHTVTVARPTTDTKGTQTIGGVNLRIGKSDVADNIPQTDIKNDKTFALIIANENYRRESQVVFAKNDGETFQKYCIQTLGLPEKHTRLVINATLNDIRGELDWITGVAKAYRGEANIIFYYAGHGIPDESARTSYLLPVDGFGSNVNTGFKLDDLYQILGKLPAKSVTVFMDACFSGAQRGEGMITADARGVAIKAKEVTPTGNTVVFSAAQGDETAYPYHDKGHGMFTYYLLKKLQETKGNVTFGELDDYISTNVHRQSIVINRKSQTPTVIPSQSLSDNWKSWRLYE